MEDNITQVVLPKKRPTFLTVLCILTFIWSGAYGILYLGYDYLTFEKTYPQKAAMFAETIETLEDAGQDSGMIYDGMIKAQYVLEKTAQNLDTFYLANIFFALLSVLGAFLMFQMKKNGFYVYAASNLFWMLVPVGIIGMELGLFAIISSMAMAILFIILYAVNLKHME
ncbi:MAG: hypothetical protein ACI93S_000500 [Ancylomarina sp.]|jgi:hypothetical protein